ncbi:MAG: hypothetical protein QOE79_2618 [Sphingomonadales bacterium]|nr:hypothetical protein [Sphingomonadales bacterium]MEA3048632.1 hypothetical protein [Sphingomonadales bacterium]
MRNLILAAGLLSLAAPAAAQPRHPAPYPPRPRVEERLPRPGEVERIGTMIERVTDALLDIDVGPVADAVDPYRRYDPRRGPDTLGELATRRDPYARRRLHAEIEDTTAGLGAATRQLETMAPLVAMAIADTRHRIDDAVRESRLRRERDYGPDYPGEYPRDR